MITTIKKVVVLLIISIFCTQTAFATKGGINVGPYYDQIPVAGGAIGPNGWVYALGCPADVQVMSRFYTGSPDYNFMIRAFYRAGDFSTPEQARKNAEDWAKALAAAPFPNKVYFVPMNEFNNPVEGFFNRNGTLLNQSQFDNFLLYLEQLQIQFNTLNIRNSRVVLLSPTIDPFFLSDHPEQQSYIRQIPWSSFDGTAISAYLQYNGNTIDSSAPSIKRGVYQDLAAAGVDVSRDVYIVETGVIKTGDGKVLYRENSTQIQDGLRNQTPSWTNNSNVKSVIIFSYNPDPGGDRSPWIYSDPGVLSALNALPGGQIVSPSTPPNASINLSEIVGSCGAEVLEPIFVDNGDNNKREQLSFRARALLQASQLLGGYFERETQIALSEIVPGSTGNIPDFTEETAIFQEILPGTLPRKFQPIERGELPENNRIGLELDKGVAPATIRASIFFEQTTTEDNDSQIDGESVAQAATDVRWAKPLRSLNTTYQSLYTPGAKLSPNKPNTISLVRPPEKLSVGPVSPYSDPQGEPIQSIQTATSDKVTFKETNIPLLVRFVADILQTFNQEEDTPTANQVEATGNASGFVYSKNYISDFTNNEHKQPGKNLIDSYLPRETKPDYSKNAQITNDYSGPGGLSQINLVSNEAAGMKEGYNKLFCSSLPRGTDVYRDRCGGGEINNPQDVNVEFSGRGINAEDLSCNNPDIQNVKNIFASYLSPVGLRNNSTFGDENLDRFSELIVNNSLEAGLNPSFVLAIAGRETNFSRFIDRPSWFVGCRGTTSQYDESINLPSLSPENIQILGNPQHPRYTQVLEDRFRQVGQHISTQISCLGDVVRLAELDIIEDGQQTTPSNLFHRFVCRWAGLGSSNNYNCNASQYTYLTEGRPGAPGMFDFYSALTSSRNNCGALQ